jgi:uncharacterized protein (TIGR02996 family)
MPTPEEGFVYALAEDLSDETTALVYADWLDDRDDPRGRFVRLQRARLRWDPDWAARRQLEQEERRLLEGYSERWLGPLRPFFKAWAFEGGLADVTVDARSFTDRRFTRAAERGLVQGHVRCLRPEGLVPAGLDDLAEASWLRVLAGLDLGNSSLTDAALDRVLACPHFERLTWLDLSTNQLTDAGVALLVRHPLTRNLRWLDLRNNRIQGGGLDRLLALFPPGGARLDLHGNPLAGMAPTTALAWLQNCTVSGGAEPASRLVNSIGMEFNRIPEGSFLMGSPEEEKDRHPREGPRRPVTLTRPCYLGTYPVTQEQYQRVLGDNPSRFVPRPERPERPGLPAHPVDSVTFELATGFCERMSALPREKAAGRAYRLPTEAEWEHAARGGTSLYPFCFGPALSSRQANFDGSRPYGRAKRGPNLRRTSPVGAYRQRNLFGAHDLYGNVCEWCADRYDEDFYRSGPRVDPRGPDEGNAHVLRGGSWYFYGMACRAAFRGYGSTLYAQDFVGLRVALDVGATPSGG